MPRAIAQFRRLVAHAADRSVKMPAEEGSRFRGRMALIELCPTKLPER
jgi:hypothetical protein